ncbi:hypothetical protein IWX50DRAFT_620244 [Phyllosticta citricarpa]
MKGFSFPPPPPPPPRATPQDGNPGTNAPPGGHGSRSARGAADRGRGRGRGRGQGSNARGGHGPRFTQHASMTTGFQAPQQNQPFPSNGPFVNYNPLPTGGYINPAFASAYTNSVNSNSIVSSWNPATVQQQTSFPLNTNVIASNPVNDSYGSHQPSSRPQSIPKPKPASKPKIAAPPAVPSFAFQLPTANPEAHVERVSKNNKKRKFNQLGLTPRSDVHEDSEGEDVDEEAKFSSGVLQFEYKGRSSTLKTNADIAAWVAERKKMWPTRARILEKQKAEDELRKAREEKRRNAEAKDNKSKAKEAPANKRKRENDDRKNMEKHLAKAEKLRKKLERAEAKLNGAASITAKSQPLESPGEVVADVETETPQLHKASKANLVGYDSDDDEQTSDAESSVISSDSSDSSTETDSESSSDDDSDSDAPPEEESSAKRPVKVAPPARKPARNQLPKQTTKKEAKRLTLRERMVEQEQQQEAELALEAIKFLGDQVALIHKIDPHNVNLCTYPVRESTLEAGREWSRPRLRPAVGTWATYGTWWCPGTDCQKVQAGILPTCSCRPHPGDCFQHHRCTQVFSALPVEFPLANTMGDSPQLATVQAGQKRKIEELTEDNTPASSEQQPSTDEGQDGWQVAQSKSSKRRKKVPKSESHNYPSIKHSPNARLQSTVKLSDLQRLALYILDEVPAPQWVAVENVKHIRKVVAIMVPGLEAGLFTGNIALDAGAQQDEAHTTEGQAEHARQETVAQHSSKHLSISPDEYYPVRLESEKLPEPLKAFADMFPHIWPIKAAGDEKYGKIQSPLDTMLNTPLPKSKDQKKENKESAKVQNARTPITKYLVTLDELLDDVPMEWTIHPAMYPTAEEKAMALSKRESDGHTEAEGWVDTRVEKMEDGNVPEKDIQQGSLTAGRKVLSMDCEMCRAANNKYVLTRVSVVDWDGNVVMDELVKPDEPIEDYLTQYSGITEEMLRDVTTTLPDIQKRLLEILTPQTILMGHSLNSDLNALKIAHPFIVDTAFLYPHPRGPPLKSSLKWLTQKYLSRSIQQGHGSSGHDSVEDARAVLDLVKLKCEKGPKWGTNDANVESIFKRLARCVRTKTQSVTGAEEHRVSAMVDWGDPRRGYGSSAQVVFGCETDEDVAKNVIKATNGPGRFDDDIPGLPVKGCDFVWARMRELEAVRGWWQAGKAPAVESLRQRAMINNGMKNSNENEDDSKSKDKNSNGEAEQEQPSAAVLATAVSRTAANIKRIYDSLPPCTALIVYSGTGDPHDSNRLQAMKRQFRQEYQTKKWDEIEVKWTDTEDQALRQAQKKMMRGCGFITVK